MRTRQAWTTSGRGPHQGSSLVTHNGPEPFCRTLDPQGDATLVWPVVPNPCLPADAKIVGSSIWLVLISDLFTLDAPIVLRQVIQLFDKSIALLDAGKWEISEQMVDEGMETGTNERYFLGGHAILFQTKNMTSEYEEYEEYAEYEEFYTCMLTLQPSSSLTSASILGMYFGNPSCSEVEMP
jgi:hypothetical protein